MTNGINDALPRLTTSIYPNPSNKIIHVDLEEPVNHISIVNHLGQIIYSRQEGSKSVQININELTYTDGIFELIVESKSGTKNYRVGLLH